MKKWIMLGVALASLCAFTTRGATITGFAMVVDGVPNSDTLDLAFLNAAIAAYNDSSVLSGAALGAGPELMTETFYRVANLGPLPTLTSTVSYRITDPLGQGLSLNSPVEYIVAHYGGQYGGADMMYYVGGLNAGTHYLSSWTDGIIDLGGISSVTFFGANVTSDSGTTSSVPDGGTSLALFGMGLCGLYTVARWQKKK